DAPWARKHRQQNARHSEESQPQKRNKENSEPGVGSRQSGLENQELAPERSERRHTSDREKKCEEQDTRLGQAPEHAAHVSRQRGPEGAQDIPSQEEQARL